MDARSAVLVSNARGRHRRGAQINRVHVGLACGRTSYMGGRRRGRGPGIVGIAVLGLALFALYSLSYVIVPRL